MHAHMQRHYWTVVILKYTEQHYIEKVLGIKLKGSDGGNSWGPQT